MSRSIKKNFLMNIFLTSSSYIFPLITFPYISRILQSSGTGQINFANSFANYFISFASLGIPMYGVRACAVVRSNKKELSKTVLELFIINLFTSILSIIILLIFVFTIPKLEDYRSLILIYSISILFNLFGIEWMYKGLEEYSYITKRSIIFKFIGVILMFCFVHQKTDVFSYAIITVLASSGSLIFNTIRARKYLNFKRKINLDIKQHIKPTLSFFLLTSSWTLYSNVDSILLGFMTNDTEVGYYSAAIKIKYMGASAIGALGTVLLPRLSNYYANNNFTKYYNLCKKNSSFTMIMGISFLSLFILKSKEIILLLSGDNYLKSIPILQILFLAIIFLGYSNMLGNILVTQNKENINAIATLIGILVIVVFNLVLIPSLMSIGSAIATDIGELSILFFEIVYLRNLLHNIFDLKNMLKIGICGLLSAFVLMILNPLLDCLTLLINLISSGCIYFVIFVILLMLVKENLCMEMYCTIKQRMSR